MKLNVEVVGMKAYKGVIDGKAIDSGVLYARIKLDGRQNVIGADQLNIKAGQCVEEWKMPSSAEVVKLKDQPMPFVAALEVERMSNGRETRDVVLGVELVSMGAASPVRKVA